VLYWDALVEGLGTVKMGLNLDRGDRAVSYCLPEGAPLEGVPLVAIVGAPSNPPYHHIAVDNDCDIPRSAKEGHLDCKKLG
jgi:hypothetical protein